MLSKTDDEVYGVMLDPDRFYVDQTTVPVMVWTGTTVEQRTVAVVPCVDVEPPLSEEEQARLNQEREAAHAAIGFPVFTIDIEEEDDPEIGRQFREAVAQRLGGLNKGSAIAPYFVVKQVTMRDKADDGNAELELFYGESISNSSRINRYTTHKFNGTTRADAAGRSVTYKDVNNNTTYVMDSDIAIWPLASLTLRVVGVDDDNDAGDFERCDNWVCDGPGPRIYQVQHYKVPSNSVHTVQWEFYDGVADGSEARDDIYDSGIDQINENSMNDRLSGRQYFNTSESSNGVLLHDIDWVVSLRYY